MRWDRAYAGERSMIGSEIRCDCYICEMRKGKSQKDFTELFGRRLDENTRQISEELSIAERSVYLKDGR